MRLNYWPRSWSLNELVCPCDIHFIEYCALHGIRDKSIFHFGTGDHHHVGTSNFDLELLNEVFGVTASKQEHTSYVDLIVERPQLANYYKVLFCDIYTLSPRCIPQFDVITLFHLCEYYSDENRAYAARDDDALLRMLLGKLDRGGRILFYRGSNGHVDTQALIDEMVRRRELEKLADYKTLTAYRSCALAV